MTLLDCPDENLIDRIINNDDRLKSLIPKDAPYEIKLLAIRNLPFLNNLLLQKKSTNKEIIDAEGTSISRFYKV